ncbi:MAG TPA: AAA family ATPase [Propionibacteriaceae bacterium]|nr:AAA family ATPase [Propionibacteriaceae bacterium]
MGEIIVVSGPPGSGKSTTAATVADRYDPSVLVVGDAFFSFLRRGAVQPWLPDADEQNRTVLAAAAAACGRLAQRYTVVYDGVLWPPYAALFAAEAGTAFHYAVLMPSLDVTLDRVRTRSDHPFADVAAATDMWRSFSTETGSVVTIDASGPADAIAAEVVRLVEAGTIRTGG